MKAEEIRPRRKALGWSQAELGERIGIPSAKSAKVLISKYETDNSTGIVSEERLALINTVLSKEEQLRREFAAFKAGQQAK